MRIIYKIKRYYKRAYLLGHYPSFLSVIRSKNKILIYYGFLGDSNFGDEVVYEAAKTLFSQNILIPVKKKMPLSLAFFCKIFNKRVYGIIIGGGTLFGRLMEQDFFQYMADLRKPTFIHGTGAHKEMGSLESWGLLLNKPLFGGVRGPLSVQNLLKYGFSMNIGGDAAFSLFETPDPIYNNRELTKNILVNVGTHNAYNGSINTQFVLKEFIKRCILEGYHIQFLPFYAIDLNIAEEFKKEIPQIEILMIPVSYAECIQYFHKSMFSIGERLHFSVMALLGNCPFLSINYDKKHEDFLYSVELINSGISPEDISLEIVVEAFENRGSFEWQEINKRIISLKNFQFEQSNKFVN